MARWKIHLFVPWFSHSNLLLVDVHIYIYMFSRLSHHVSCCHSFPLNHPVGSWISGVLVHELLEDHLSTELPHTKVSQCHPVVFRKDRLLVGRATGFVWNLGSPKLHGFSSCSLMFIDVHWCSFNFPLKIAVTWVYPPSLRQTLKWKRVLISATHHQWHGFGISMSHFFKGNSEFNTEFPDQKSGQVPWILSMDSISKPLLTTMNTTSAQRSWKSPA